jgi:RNA polymerase sigma-70 factor, ECF subfamily
MQPVVGAMYPEQVALHKDDSAVTEGTTLQRVDSKADLTFEELFDRYKSMVFGLVFQILGDREEALDVSQEVFLTIYRKLASFRGESSLKTWIYCIAVHRASNRFRWWNRLRRRGTVSLEELLDKGAEPDFCASTNSGFQSPEDALLIEEEHAEIQRLLLNLPLQQRTALVLRDIEGLSYEEIAKAMKISLGTVKSRIARGREMLKRSYKRSTS